ncbi:MAG: hypothetical protein H0X33_13420 [Taibaiella sp.]|nr:hypothetical protein [Taibaiella sp.]
MKTKEKLVAVTFWIPISLKDAANEVAERRGDITRMLENGLRKEVTAKRIELAERDIETKLAS